MRTLLRNRDFTRLFLGRLVTNAGDSMYFIAAMWLVYRLSGSPFYSGLAGSLTLLPMSLQALTGPLVDRWPLRRVLVGTQVIQGVLVLVIPVADWLGVLTYWHVLLIMPIVSMLNQFVYPAQNAALPRLVDGDELVSANSALSVAYQGVDMAFNGLAGVLVALVGAVSLYLLDSVTFAAATLLFATIRLPPLGGDGSNTGGESDTDAGGERTKTDAPDEADSALASYLSELREGINYVRGTVLMPMLATSLVANCTLGGVEAVLPAFADSMGGSTTYGLLTASISGGVLVGALGASWFEDLPYGTLAIGGFGLGACCWFAALLSPWPVGRFGLLFLAFVPIGVTNVISSALFQRLVPDAMLGRVTSVMGSASTLMMPLGALGGGALATTVGPISVMAIGGAGLLFIAVYVAAIPRLRRFPAVGRVESLERRPGATSVE